jgi:hypothetical protein
VLIVHGNAIRVPAGYCLRPFSSGGFTFPPPGGHQYFPAGGAESSYAAPRFAHFSLLFLYILPSRYLSSRIVHLIYRPTLPARTLRVRTHYVLLHRNIFPTFSVACTSLRSPSRRFVSYLKYLASSRASIYGILFCHQAQLYLALRSREAGSLRAARRTCIYTLAV